MKNQKIDEKENKKIDEKENKVDSLFIKNNFRDELHKKIIDINNISSICGSKSQVNLSINLSKTPDTYFKPLIPNEISPFMAIKRKYKYLQTSYHNSSHSFRSDKKSFTTPSQNQMIEQQSNQILQPYAQNQASENQQALAPITSNRLDLYNGNRNGDSNGNSNGNSNRMSKSREVNRNRNSLYCNTDAMKFENKISNSKENYLHGVNFVQNSSAAHKRYDHNTPTPKREINDPKSYRSSLFIQSIANSSKNKSFSQKCISIKTEKTVNSSITRRDTDTIDQVQFESSRENFTEEDLNNNYINSQRNIHLLKRINHQETVENRSHKSPFQSAFSVTRVSKAMPTDSDQPKILVSDESLYNLDAIKKVTSKPCKESNFQYHVKNRENIDEKNDKGKIRKVSSLVGKIALKALVKLNQNDECLNFKTPKEVKELLIGNHSRSHLSKGKEINEASLVYQIGENNDIKLDQVSLSNLKKKIIRTHHIQQRERPGCDDPKNNLKDDNGGINVDVNVNECQYLAMKKYQNLTNRSNKSSLLNATNVLVNKKTDSQRLNLTALTKTSKSKKS